MKVEQVASLLNNGIVKEFVGESLVINEDLSNIADFGRQFSQLDGDNNYENFHKKICDKIGKQIFWDRAYDGFGMNILRDGSEYGSVVEKVRFTEDEFKTNYVWALQNGQKYDDFLTFNALNASVKYWNSKVTFRISLDKPYNQVKSAMLDAGSFMRYVAAIEQVILNKKAMAFKALTQRVHTAMVANRIGNNKAVIDLLGEYNTKFTPSPALTAEKAFYNKDFLRYAIARIADISSLMTEMSKLYNDGTYATFTPANMQILAMNSLFSANIETYLKSETFNPQFLAKLKDVEAIPFWQGTGMTTGGSLSERTKIDSTIYDEAISGDTKELTVSRDFIIGTLRDRDSIAIFNEDEYALSFQNPDTGVTKTNYMTDVSLFGDTAENFVVFVLGTGSSNSTTNTRTIKK